MILLKNNNICSTMTKVMVLKATSIALISLFLLLLPSICISDQTEASSGFTIDLIHRDSPQSPSFDSSSNPYRRLIESFNRSHHRARNLKSLISPPRAEEEEEELQPRIINHNGAYFMEYLIGTPPVATQGEIDTTSDLTWTQCKSCKSCFHQDLPIFDQTASSTYKQVSCNSARCNSSVHNFCSKTGSHCRYSVCHSDGMFSSGVLATDTFTFNPDISIPDMMFGCGSINREKFALGASGFVGLGGGKDSFIQQLGPIAQGKFSHCLVSIMNQTHLSSKLHFGKHAAVSGEGTVTTPMVKKKPDTFYYVTLEGITIGNRTVRPMPDQTEGNIILDSGMLQTVLPPEMYEELEAELRSSVKLEEIVDPFGMLRLCYPTTVEGVRFPEVVVHFRGADVRLHQDNILARMNNDMMCLAVMPASPNTVPVYGNLAMANFLVGYDLVKKTVTFKPVDCTTTD